MATAPSNILSVGRLLCFVAGSFYGMSKVGSLQASRDKLDLEMVKKWDAEQLNIPESNRHYLAIASAKPVAKVVNHDDHGHGHHH